MIFPEIDEKETKKNVKNLLGTYPHLIRRASKMSAPKITSDYHLVVEVSLEKQQLAGDFSENEEIEEEIKKIVRSINKLDLFERQLICDRFIRRKKTNVALYMSYHVSESKFYREMAKALLHFAESYDHGRLLDSKE